MCKLITTYPVLHSFSVSLMEFENAKVLNEESQSEKLVNETTVAAMKGMKCFIGILF